MRNYFIETQRRVASLCSGWKRTLYRPSNSSRVVSEQVADYNEAPPEANKLRVRVSNTEFDPQGTNTAQMFGAHNFVRVVSEDSGRTFSYVESRLVINGQTLLSCIPPRVSTLILARCATVLYCALRFCRE